MAYVGSYNTYSSSELYAIKEYEWVLRLRDLRSTGLQSMKCEW